MFDIEYKGGTTVVISTKKSTLVIDPKLSLLGVKDVVVKGGIELASETRFVLGSESAKLSLEGPGEYEVGDFSIRGVAAVRHIDTAETEMLATMYRVEVGDVRIAVLGNVAEAMSEEQLEALGVVDILILPVGGGGLTLDATAAANLVRRIDDPKVIIPVHYDDKALKYEMPQSDLATFVSELGAPTEETSKYKVKSAASIPAVLTVVEVTRS